MISIALSYSNGTLDKESQQSAAKDSKVIKFLPIVLMGCCQGNLGWMGMKQSLKDKTCCPDASHKKLPTG